MPIERFVGEASSLGAAFLWAVAMMMYAPVTKDMPSFQLNYIKNVVSLFFFALTLAFFAPGKVSFWNDAYLWLMVSGVVGITLGDSFFFRAMRDLGPQLTSSIQCLAPGMTTFLAYILLNETLTEKELIGLVITTLSIAFLLIGSRKSFHLSQEHLWRGVFWALMAALGQAMGMVLVRFSLVDLDVILATLLRMLPATICLYVIGVSKGHSMGLKVLWSHKSWKILALSALIGTYGGLMLLTLGTKYAKAGIASALSSTYPLWVIPLSVVFLKEKTSVKDVFWTLCAVSGVVLMMV